MAILTCRENFIRLNEIDQVMRNAALLCGRHFCGADIEMAIDLCRIANENLSAHPLGKFDPERRLAGSRGPEDDNEPREITHRANAQYRKRRESNTSAASNSAPTTCVRFSFNAG